MHSMIRLTEDLKLFTNKTQNRLERSSREAMLRRQRAANSQQASSVGLIGWWTFEDGLGPKNRYFV